MLAIVGPQPGSLVMEGVYQMSFTFQAPGIPPQSCHYKLRVKGKRPPFFSGVLAAKDFFQSAVC